MLADLTLPMREGMPIHPNHPTFEAEERSYETETHSVRFRRFTSSNHQGTHVDAPAHFVEEGPTIEQLDLELFVGQATVVDLHDYSGEAITDEVLKAALDGRSPTDRTLLATGDASELYASGAFFEDAAYLTGEAAEWLLDEGVSLVAMDFLGENPDEPGAPVHTALLGAGVPIVDYVCNTGAIVAHETVEFFCFPLKMPGFDAAPARVLARI